MEQLNLSMSDIDSMQDRMPIVALVKFDEDALRGNIVLNGEVLS